MILNTYTEREYNQIDDTAPLLLKNLRQNYVLKNDPSIVAVSD